MGQKGDMNCSARIGLGGRAYSGWQAGVGSLPGTVECGDCHLHTHRKEEQQKIGPHTTRKETTGWPSTFGGNLKERRATCCPWSSLEGTGSTLQI